jgi:uncharacterized protein YbjT (DUF2867 family)
MKSNNKQTVLLAGATGYLGGYIATLLYQEQIHTKLITRSPQKLKALESKTVKIITAEVTKPNTLVNSCEGVMTVISTIGITRQKDGLTYMDVDYQANMNLLNEAKRAGVKKFIYVSAINGNNYRHLKIFEAKEKFVDALKLSGLDYTILRPNGFFSDMKEVLEMAKSGRVYLFGKGEQKLNPIHGADLAVICVQAIYKSKSEISVGGPDLLTLNEISELALEALDKSIKIYHLPDWTRRFLIWVLRRVTSSKTYGPIEFFLTLMSEDQIAPRFGIKRLVDFFRDEAERIIKQTK